LVRFVQIVSGGFSPGANRLHAQMGLEVDRMCKSCKDVVQHQTQQEPTRKWNWHTAILNWIAEQLCMTVLWGGYWAVHCIP